MKHSKVFGYGVAILFVALWIVPLTRAVSFVKSSDQSYDGTINAYEDVAFSKAILASYSVSLCLSLLLAWLILRYALWTAVPSAALLVWKVVQVIRFHPEEPLVLIPTIYPVGFAVFHLVVVALTTLLVFLPFQMRRHRQSHPSPNHTLQRTDERGNVGL